MQNKRIADANIGPEDSVSMSSDELQRIFYSTYQNFFHTHDLVLSGDSILTWGADLCHGVSNLRLKQKLPMKTFCGMRRNTSGKITFRTIFVYSILEHSFKQVGFSSFFPHEMDAVIRFLEDFCKKNNYTGGIEIDFLSETPPGQGFAFSAVISVLLSFLISLATQKLDPQILTRGELRQDDRTFDELYLLSLEISRCISKSKSISGATNYTVMVPGISSPIVHLSDKNHTSTPSGEERPTLDRPRSIHKVLYMDTLYHVLGIDTPSASNLPLDYGILFTGRNSRFGEIEATRDAESDEAGGLQKFLSDTIQSLSTDEDTRVRISEILSLDKEGIIYKNIDMMSLKILEAFHTLLIHTKDSDSSGRFIETIQKMGLVSFSYQKINKLFFALKYSFDRYKQFEDEEIGILPFNTGKIGGSLLFVMKSEKSRTTLQKVMDQLRSDGYIVSLAYSSWRDGVSTDGIRLEQYISKEIYSKYTKKGDVYYRDSSGRDYCDNYDTIMKMERAGILLDTISGRIYVCGEKLTSADIHSQNTTIDMLKILLEHIGQEVSNDNLPISTYSQNKNEILGKVVLPIKKIAKEYFGHEISLTCSGGITEYFLRLEKDDLIPIGIIQKL